VLAQATVRAAETLLYRKASDAEVVDTITSFDVRHVGCVEKRGRDRYTIVVDGARAKEVGWIVGQTLAFSLDGRRFTYTTQHDGLTFVAVGDVPGAVPGASGGAAPAGRSEELAVVEDKGYYMAGRVAFSPDGARHAYRAKLYRGGPSVLVLDGKEGQPFDSPAGRADEDADDLQMTFSKDGRQFAHRARWGGKQSFVVNGVPGPAYDAVVAFVFSADGKRWAYRARVGKEAFVVSGGEGWAAKGNPPSTTPAAVPDPGSTVAASAPAHREHKRYDMVYAMTFSPDGRHLAYAADVGGKQMLVMNETEFRKYDGLGDVQFSPDGRRIGITTQTRAADGAEQWQCFVDGKGAAFYEGIGRLHFSPDGKHLAYAAGRSTSEGGRRQFVVTDGKEGPPFEGVGTVAFSPDGSRVAYAALAGGEKVLVIDGRRFGPAGFFAFSPDGRRVAHALPRPQERWVLAIDGVEARRADGQGRDVDAEYHGFPLGSRIVFDQPAVARTILGRGDELIRVELSVEPKQESARSLAPSP
jgi:hypothetical protein